MPSKKIYLDRSRRNKKDDFFTKLIDIEKELKYYEKHFKNKIVYCNCDDVEQSNFVKYFKINFKRLGLRRLFVNGYKLTSSMNVVPSASGDFRSEESLAMLKQADIVVTNPPFSLFTEYVTQLLKYDKKFLIIGNVNAITYNVIFKHIKENKIRLGVSISTGHREFGVSDEYPLNTKGSRVDDDGKKYIDVPGVRWFTNLEHGVINKKLFLDKIYTPDEYPKYNNYNAINVDRVKDIPIDYYGAIGVPVTFMDKHNPDQFEVLGTSSANALPGDYHYKGKSFNVSVGDRNTYKRIFIKRK